MDKRARPRIRPPKVPKGEGPWDTVAVQEKQINMMIDRIEQLTGEADRWARDCRSAEIISDKVQNELREVREAYTRLQGWQDCAREILQSKSTGE